jgi:hypothetical protein
MMRKRDQFQIIVELAIDDKEREASKWKPANALHATDSWDDAACPGMVRDELHDVLNLAPQAVSKARAFRFIPMQVVANLRFCSLSRSDRFPHRPKISRSIRCRTSFQSDATLSPASVAAQRRSTSSAQSSSMAGSVPESRLSSRRAASSARSDSGNSRT